MCSNAGDLHASASYLSSRVARYVKTGDFRKLYLGISRRIALCFKVLIQPYKPNFLLFDYPTDFGFIEDPTPMERILPGSVSKSYLGMHLAPYHFALDYAKGKRVLEVGCNWGYGAHLLSSVAAHVTAFDVSKEAIRDAQQRFQCDNLGFFVHDANDPFPLPGEGFDLVFSSEVIEHIRDYRACIAEIKRVLRPGGILIMKTPNIEADPMIHRRNPYHLKVFTPSEYRNLLEHYFEDVRVLGYNEVYSHSVHYSVVDFDLDGYRFGEPIPCAKKLEVIASVRPELVEVTGRKPEYLLAICSDHPLPGSGKEG
jgi:2-polyprenyl-3-methyl-5-hydroxy-6-metoxy-1,4-benzoquinol methylase